MGRSRKKKNYSQLGDQNEKETATSCRKGRKQPPRGVAKNRKKKNIETASDYTESDEKFRKTLENEGQKTIVEMESDGNCLFRSLSDQLFWDHGAKHEDIRSEVCDFMESHEEEFSVFLVLDDDDEDASDFNSYIESMRESGEWGGNLELVAAARLYCRKIKVFSVTAAYTIDHDKTEKSTGPDLMVSYHDNDHYNSVRDYNGKKPPSPSIPRHLTESLGEAEPNVLLKEEENGISAELHSAPSSSKESEESEALISKNEMNNNEAAQTQGWLKKKKKRGGPCPCGSGQSYRKCCLASDKRKASDARRKMSSVNDSCTNISHEEERQSAQAATTTEMENGFKVLNI
mmetsp:Transcript_27296/g.41283  ORF Transcript_27296/g.41283 Transcript_27296/m.41283 type:complete len:346 (-) Transcript_27296:122-1159(-)|eukprot:CAMPEP_0178914312 /NCGR_PEP_ID=MMETSP0786-20121207/11354_1 /TAXON_ID=186022 /ORGANISM="Thalassionema frauenfeldii, Strain CCMP 1798" /LENGTH=345 /DNA_ID=CAMNT_0020587203 /DNA_START=120 /DNA_END=1157 /DNA_ORIENTATION=+